MIEETNKGRARYTQKMLEWLHLHLLLSLENCGSGVYYVSSSIWRRSLDLALSKEDKKNNSAVNQAKRVGKSKKELGLVGKINKKHLAIRYVNEHLKLNLRMKDNDIADAVCLGLAFLNNAQICDGK